MTREEARIYWTGRYEAAKKWDDPHWEASERKEHRRYVDALNAAIKALSSAEPEKTYIGIDIPYGSDKGIATIFKGKDDKLILEKVKELMRSWIPCSERLPEEGQMVLTTIRGHDVIIPQDGETLEEAMERVWNEVCYVSVGFIGSDGWYGADGFPQIVHPIAWMPLPKPYREDGEEE